MAINLGDISFGLGPDTRLLDRARQSVLQFGQAVNRAAQSQADGARQAEAALRKQEQALLSALQSTLNLNQAIRATGDGQNIIQSTTATYNRLVRELSSGQVSALQFQRSMEDFQASTGRASRALKDLQAAKRAEAATEREAAAAARAAEQQQLRNNEAYFRAEMSVSRFTQTLQKLPAAQRAAFAGQANSALAAFQQQLAASGGNAARMQAAQQQMSRSMQTLRNEVAQTAAALRVDRYEALAKGLRGVADVAILLNGPLSGIATRLTLLSGIAERFNLTMAALVVGVSAGTYAFVSLGSAAIEASRIYDRTTVALTGLTGSTAIAGAEMSYIWQVADKTGARFENLATQYVQLSAASKGTALQGQATRHIFENIVMVAQRMGSSNEELAGSLRAIQQIMSKGKVAAEELRQQLGDRFPGSVQIMAAALGKGTAELDDLMKKGQLGIGALVKFADEAVKRFGVDTSASIENVTAAEGRWANQQTRTARALDETVGFTQAYISVLKTGTGALQFFEQNMSTLVSSIGALSGGIAGYMAMLYAPALLTGIQRTIAGVRALAVAMTALNAASLANPFGAGIMLLTRLAAAAVGAAAGYKILQSSLRETAGEQEQLNQKATQYLEAYRQMKLGITGTTKELIAQQEASATAAEQQIAGLTRKIEDAKAKIAEAPETDGYGFGSSANDLASQRQISKWSEQLGQLRTQADTARNQVAQLKQVLTEQQESEAKGFNVPAIIPGKEKKEKEYHLSEAERMLETLREHNRVLREQSTTNGKLTQEELALVKFNEEIANIKERKILTADQKSLVANEGAIRLMLLMNSELAKKNDLQDKSLKLQERIEQITASMQSSRDNNLDKYSMQLDIMGLGDQEAQRLQERIQLMREGQRQIEQLTKATPKELIDSEQYRAGVEQIRGLTQQQLQDLDAYYAQLDKKNKDWVAGANQGWNNYVNAATNAYTNAEQAFTATMGGIENALTGVLSKGKTTFKEFANSVIAELARIAAKAVVVNMSLLALGSMGYSSFGGLLKGLGFGSGGTNTATPTEWSPYGSMLPDVPVAGGRASGGPTSPGALYEVNEKGPELYTSGGRTYLMAGSDGGYVTPISNRMRSGGSDGGDTFTIATTVNVGNDGNSTTTSAPAQSGGSAEMGKQLASQLNPTIKSTIVNEMRPGGVLWKWKQGQI